jgi:uncharacterized repeat protein (TIGR04138 family)
MAARDKGQEKTKKIAGLPLQRRAFLSLSLFLFFPLTLCPPGIEDVGMAADQEAGKSLQEVIAELGLYPIEAFEFVQKGLAYTVNKTHGPVDEKKTSRHVSGQQLSIGLRDYALMQWGMLAGTVLRRWNITNTYDFGRIVFALIDAGFMQRTSQDTIDDFRDVYEFKDAFDSGYKIEAT